MNRAEATRQLRVWDLEDLDDWERDELPTPIEEHIRLVRAAWSGKPDSPFDD